MSHTKHESWPSLTSVVQRGSVCEACAFLLLPEETHVFVDMLQAKAWIIYMNTHFSSFVMYIWTWACKKISIFWPENLNKSLWSSRRGMEERQVHQSYREALVQISLTTNKKIKEKGKWGHCVVSEWEQKKEKETGRKRVKIKQKLKFSFINAVSIHYRCIYAIRWGICHCLRRQ